MKLWFHWENQDFCWCDLWNMSCVLCVRAFYRNESILNTNCRGSQALPHAWNWHSTDKCVLKKSYKMLDYNVFKVDFQAVISTLQYPCWKHMPLRSSPLLATLCHQCPYICGVHQGQCAINLCNNSIVRQLFLDSRSCVIMHKYGILECSEIHELTWCPWPHCHKYWGLTL